MKLGAYQLAAVRDPLIRYRPHTVPKLANGEWVWVMKVLALAEGAGFSRLGDKHEHFSGQ